MSKNSKVKYVCIRTCTWADRYWREGESVYVPSNVKPPHHFELADSAAKRIAEEQAIAAQEADRELTPAIDAANAGKPTAISALAGDGRETSPTKPGAVLEVAVTDKGEPVAFLE